MNFKMLGPIRLVFYCFIIIQVSIGWGVSAMARELKDQAGREVSVPERPKRVVSLAPSITEIVYDLGREDLLVGVTQFSNYPAEATRLPRVGSYVRLDLEKIVSLNPDLCIAVKDGNPIEVIRRLADFNIPVFAIDPDSVDSVVKTVSLLGTLLNADRRGHLLAADMRRRIDRVTSRTAQIPHRPSVFFQIGISPIVSVGSNTVINELITLAGGINAAAGRVPYPRFSREQIIEMKPEVMILTSMARGGGFRRAKTEWQMWTQIPAIENKRIYLIDSDLVDRPTPRLVEGLEVLAGMIHPELFKAAP